MTGRVSRYTTSTKHIVGCACAIGGPALALAGVVSAPVGLVLVPVLYAGGALAVRKRRAPVAQVAGLDPRYVNRELDELHRRVMAAAPAEIEYKVVHISRVIRETLPRAGALGTGSPGQFVLVQCALDYLPSAVANYLRLPRAYADHYVVADGKTSRQLVVEQLDLLARQVDEVAAAVNRADVNDLLVHGRFLAEKFEAGALTTGKQEP